MTTSATFSPAELDFLHRQRVGHLATANAQGTPHVVPVCFAYDGMRFFIALDDKPKRVPAAQLVRVRNIAQRAEVSLVLDEYSDDWSRLGFVLVAATATLLAPAAADHPAAVALLRARYPQYRAMPLEDRQLIALRPTHIVSWGTPAREPANAAQPRELASQDAQLAGAAYGPGEEPAALDGRGIDFLPLARGRRSVRSFQARPVERAAIEYVLEAARWAPSPHGRQPWRFVVLTTPQRKAQLAAAMGDDWQRILAMDQEPPAVVAARVSRSRERIEQAPALILVCLYLADLDQYPDPERQEAEHTMAVQSLGAAVQNLLLAAYALGLDTGWMCAPLFCGQVVRDALGLDAHLLPHALIPLGYAAGDPVRRPRRPLPELVSFLD